MFAVISGPDFLSDIEKSLKTLNRDIFYKKVDREISLTSEIDKIIQYNIETLILDISCVEDYKRVPQAIRKLTSVNEKVRIILLVPYEFKGDDIVLGLISMGIYDVIGKREYERLTIEPSLTEHIRNPATYAKAVKWNEGVNYKNFEDDIEQLSEGKRLGKSGLDSPKTVTIEKDKIIGTVVVAIAGAMNRIGTTHTAISLARFLIGRKLAVAVVEMHNSNNFDAIKNSYENVEEKSNRFSLCGIDFYPYDQYASVSDFVNDDYEYIVLDMGVYNKCNLAEFKRAHERIIVSGVKDWELEALEDILENNDWNLKNKYYFTFADKDMFEFTKQNMNKLLCYQAVYNPQAFGDNEECDKVFRDMLKGVLPQSLSKDNQAMFLNLKKKR